MRRISPVPHITVPIIRTKKPYVYPSIRPTTCIGISLLWHWLDELVMAISTHISTNPTLNLVV